MSDPVVTFLSDYGLADEFVGVCHAVIARRAPRARMIDLTHGVPRHDVRAGALLLRASVPFAEPGVHLAVVDPEVGAERRAVALRCGDGRVFVGPDNGLLVPAAAQAGGVVEAVDVGRSPHRLEPVSATFHGRDIFAPVAGALAAGEPFGAAGEPLDVDELVALDLPHAHVDGDGALVTHVLLHDGFGNVVLDAGHEELAGTGLRLGRPVDVALPDGSPLRRAHYATTFADVEPGEIVVYEDATRSLALAINRGDAARELGLERDSELRLRPA